MTADLMPDMRLRYLCACSWILVLLTFSTARAQDLAWAVSYGTDTIHVYEVLPDSLGNIYSMGFFQGTGDFNPGPGVYPLTSTTPTEVDIFIQKTDQGGNLIWAVSLGGPGLDRAYSMAVDALGGVLVAGNFNVSMDADPGAGVFTLSAPATGSFILRLDPSGNLVWARQYSQELDIEGVVIGAGGRIILSGLFSSTVDFDPGAGVSNLTASNPYDSFLLQLTSSGVFDWAHHFVSNGLRYSGSLALDSDGNILFTGQYGGSVDFDPGPAAYPLTGTGAFNGYVCKCDVNGDLLWVQAFPGYVIAEDIAVAPGNDILFTGYFNDTIDFDPGPGMHLVTESVTPPSNPFLLKLDSAGDFKWVYAPAGMCIPRTVAADIMGNIFLGGFFSDTTDFDPGPGALNLVTPFGTGIQNGFIAKLDRTGLIIWAGQIEAGENTWVRSLAVNPEGDLLAGGYHTGPADFDPLSGVVLLPAPAGQQRAFVTKWHKDCNIRIEIDSLKNMDCSGGPGFASAHVTGSSPPFSLLWGTTPASVDTFAILPSDSIYPLMVTDALGCVKITSVRADEALSYSGFDLEPYGIGGLFTPGLNTTVNLCASNQGCLPTAGTLQIVLDPLSHFISSSPAPGSVSGDTLTWITPSLQFDLPPFCVALVLQTDGAAMLGDSLALEVSLSPFAGDLDTTNNVKEYTFTVVAPYDPNHKTVFPAGVCDAHFVKTGTRLEYAVEFQNLGSAEATNVWVQDTLDFNLDPATLSVRASSHPMTWEILPDNVMQINFMGIHLPDSSSDPAGSTGFVLFECSHNTGLPDFTLIQNQAQIIFDYNAPIATNTVLNTIVDTIPQYLFYTDEYVCSGSDFLFPDGTWALNVTLLTTHESSLSSMYGCDSSVVTTLHPVASDTSVSLVGDSALMANGAATTYQWVDCGLGYAPIAGATAPVYTPAVSGSFAVILTQYGCSDTSACYPLVLTSSAPSATTAGISVYPNPASGSVTISLGKPSTQLQIFDATGQIVWELDTKGILETEMDISQLSHGIYFVLATGEAGVCGTRLVVK